MEVQEKYPKSRKNLALSGRRMYKFERNRQLGLAGFNQLACLQSPFAWHWVRL